MLVDLEYIRREKDGRLYVRRHGRSIRLRQKPGTAAFLDEYQLALQKLEAAAPAPKLTLTAPAKDSFRWLCTHYYRSAEFKLLAPSTQKMRRRILDAVCVRHGAKPFALMEASHVRQLRDAKAEMPEAANSLLKALRALFAWAVESEHVESNPAKLVPKLNRPSEGFHTWTVEEVRQFEAHHPPGSKPRLALWLLLYAGGPRRSDVVRLGRQMIRDGWLTYKPVKTAKTGQIVSVPVLPELQAEIDRQPKTHMAFLVTAYGKPFTAAGFGMRFREWCNAAGLPHCSAHGLRKASATLLAERGASERQLNAFFGWAESSNESRRYTRAAQQKVLARGAVDLFRDEAGTGDSPKANPRTVPKAKNE
jgi:integrase